MEASTLIVFPELLPSYTCKSEQSKLKTLKEMFPGVNDVDVAASLWRSNKSNPGLLIMLKTSWLKEVFYKISYFLQYFFTGQGWLNDPSAKVCGSSENPMLTMFVDLRYYKCWHYYMIYVKIIDNTSKVHSILDILFCHRRCFWIPPVNTKWRSERVKLQRL